MYVDKSPGYNAYIDGLRAEIIEQEENLHKLKEKDRTAYYMALPTLKQSAKRDKILDVYDLIRAHGFSPRISFNYSTAVNVKKQKIAGIKPSKLLQRVSLKDARAIAEDPTKYLAYRILDKEDEAKRKGYHSGLNVDDLLIYLIRDLIGENEHLIRASKIFDGHRSRRDRANLVKGVFDVISFYVLSEEYGAYFQKELAERNFNLEYLSKKSKRFNGFQLALLQCLNSLTWSLWGIDINKHPKLPNLPQKPTEAQATRLKSLSQKLFNFIWLYNTRLDQGTEFRKATDQAVEKYIVSDKYKEKHPEGDVSKADLIRSHRQYLIDVFLSLNNLSDQFTIKKDGREYSSITAHPSALRPLTPSRLKEIDFRQLNPRIAAMWLDAHGHPELLNKVQLGDIYKIEGITRNEAKVKINTTLNLHTAHERREKSFLEIGMTTQAAKLWANTFANKGSFFRMAAEVEKALVEKVAAYYREHQTEGFRLHDAYITQQKTISVKPLTEVEITYSGKKYAYPLGSTDWN